MADERRIPDDELLDFGQLKPPPDQTKELADVDDLQRLKEQAPLIVPVPPELFGFVKPPYSPPTEQPEPDDLLQLNRPHWTPTPPELLAPELFGSLKEPYVHTLFKMTPEEDVGFKGVAGHDHTTFSGTGTRIGPSNFLGILSDVTPDADSTRDIGSPTRYWALGYFDTIYLHSTITLASTLAYTPPGGSSANWLQVDPHLRVGSGLTGSILCYDIGPHSAGVGFVGSPTRPFDKVYANSILGITDEITFSGGGSIAGPTTNQIDITGDTIINSFFRCTDMRVLEGGASPTFYSSFIGGDQAANVVYTLPIALPAADYFLQSTSGGVMTWQAKGVGNVIPIYVEGTVVDEETIFDGLLFKTATDITKITLFARTAPTGANITVDLLKDGAEQTQIATLTAASTYEETTVSASFTTAQRFGVKIKSVGSTEPGEGLCVLVHGTTPVASVGAHASTHENGGSDEINVGSLSGKLADLQDAGWLEGRDIAATAPTDNQVLVWNASASQWQPAATPAATATSEWIETHDINSDTLVGIGQANVPWVTPFVVANKINVNYICCYVAQALVGASFSIGVYDDGGSRVLYSGVKTGNSTTGLKIYSAVATLEPGQYYYAATADNGASHRWGGRNAISTSGAVWPRRGLAAGVTSGGALPASITVTTITENVNWPWGAIANWNT